MMSCDIASLTRVVFGSHPAAVARTVMSRSVSMPTTRLPSQTGIGPTFSTSMMRAACSSVSPGETTPGSRVMISLSNIGDPPFGAKEPMRDCGPLPRPGQLVEFAFRLVPLPAEPLLELADDLVPLAGGLVQVVVGQLSPLLLDLALELLPVALDLIPIHGVPRDKASSKPHRGPIMQMRGQGVEGPLRGDGER